ncbi:MAG: DNA cytosine methyltransferase [Verrucomicrobia bacterium]|nr:DNA cytosine methyltransferase [Verrucomicrobiota bacterium]
MPNRLPSAIDLFCGCGGVTYGLKSAGFEVIGAIELDPVAAATYRLNHIEERRQPIDLITDDIRKVNPIRWRERFGLLPGELSLLAGCPPCQGFSTLRTLNGSRQNRDRRNGLVRQMLKFARAFLPQAIMMENVPDLQNRQVFIEFVEGLKSIGYSVAHDVKDVKFFGVPQRRRRLVLVAGLDREIPFAAPTTQLQTVRQAISSLKPAGRSGDALHDFPEIRSEKVRRLISLIPKNGGSRNDLPASEQLPCHRRCDGFKDIYGRIAWDNVAPTITTGCFNPSKGRFLHPDEDRNITMREAALLQSFPDDFIVPIGTTKTAIAAMVGNALPPEFIRRQSVVIKETLIGQ